MKPYHKNPRQITEKQFNNLSQWLDELGDLSGIVHNLNSDEVIGGNQRGRVFDIFNNGCEIVIERKLDKPDRQGTVGLGFILWNDARYQYRQVRWTPEQCEKANIVANKAGGTWDFDILANEFEVMELVEWGFEPFELGIDLDELFGKPKETPPQIDKADELQKKWQTEVGQLWQLGPHRLICGDCTDRAVVDRVMGGERADMVFTSPPYNRGTTTGGGFNDKGLSQQLTNGYEGYNDNLPKEKYYEWQAILLSQWWSIISNDGVIYYNHRPRVQNGVYETPLDWNPGLPVRQVVIWNSGGGVNFAPTHYRPSCEWVVIFAKPSFRLTSKSMSGYGDVWDIPVAGDRWGHPAPFPVALPERALETTSSIIIYEPFLGSGTTLIACENLGRRCRAVELSPAYTAVCLERFKEHSGIQPELIG